MVYNYVVTLRNQQKRSIDLLGFLLSLSSLLFFVREMSATREVRLALLLGSIFIFGLLLWNIYQANKLGRKVYYSRALLVAALVWMKMPYFQWLSFLYIILALLEYQAKYSVEIGFSDRQIVINQLFKKKYSWTDFSHIVLKDGLLTLDFRNNKVLQREVEEDEEDDADEDEFNEYCRQRLSAAREG